MDFVTLEHGDLIVLMHIFFSLVLLKPSAICFKVRYFLHSLGKKSVFMSSSFAPKKALSFYYPITSFCNIFLECSS